ncbi:hypothetical protein CR513_49434, partial [Mucuna pruriens]
MISDLMTIYNSNILENKNINLVGNFFARDEGQFDRFKPINMNMNTHSHKHTLLLIPTTTIIVFNSIVICHLLSLILKRTYKKE